MKKILLFAFFLSYVFSATKSEIFNDYKNEKYLQVCKNGIEIIKQEKEDEVFINTVAYSCLKSDMIDMLALPAVLLKKTPSSRLNASYYSTILFQKKLLYQALVDGMDISLVRTPKTDYVLSRVFDAFVENKYEKTDKSFIFSSDNNRYELRVIDSSAIAKIEIKEYKDGVHIKTYIYY
ncbi:MAG: hypothetical protein QG567_2038 [Campylobacterota bacterium]|nr:hypothetical protein [Campylobacterota bacterium]